MLKVLLFILYVQSGNLKLEQKYYDNMDQCKAAGQSRAAELMADPRVDGIIAGGCLPGDAQEVQK